MATATKEAATEIEAQAPSENGETAETRRKRVDPATLPADEKVLVSTQIPAGMKVQALQASNAAGVPITQWMRDTLANALGYAVPTSYNERKRTTALSGMSEEEKKEYHKNQQKAQRENMKKMLNTVNSLAGTNPDLIAQLEAAGVDVSVLGLKAPS